MRSVNKINAAVIYYACDSKTPHTLPHYLSSSLAYIQFLQRERVLKEYCWSVSLYQTKYVRLMKTSKHVRSHSHIYPVRKTLVSHWYPILLPPTPNWETGNKKFIGISFCCCLLFCTRWFYITPLSNKRVVSNNHPSEMRS